MYMAPELYYCDTYDPSAGDMWALGVILYILLTGRRPFNFSSERCKAYRSFCRDGFVFNTDISLSAIDLICHLLVPVAERYTLQQVLEHP